MASTASPANTSAAETSQTQTEARAAVIACLDSAGSNYDHQYQRRATDLHANATAIAKQEADLTKQTVALAKESVKWEKELTKTTKGLNEFGDMQNWAELMERDFSILEETLRLAEGGDLVESASGGSQWR